MQLPETLPETLLETLLEKLPQTQPQRQENDISNSSKAAAEISGAGSPAVESQNVDPAEIEKFSELASRWWDPESEFKPLHEINPLRLTYINERAGLNGKQVIDVGCGGGILSESMARKGAVVTAIDLSDAALTVARLHALESKIDVAYKLVSAEEYAAENQGQFDVVTCLEMLEHVPNPSLTVQSCARLVKPGGRVFFSTLNRNPKSWLFAILGAEHVLKLLPAGTHEYSRFIKPSELGNWCRAEKLNVTHMTGMTYNPVSKQYRLVSDVSVNYMLETVKPE